MAEEFCEVGGGITLCYETFGDPSSPPLLLIMGLGTQMIGWPDEFCRQLAECGFYVVRFDNRDSGRSTQIEGRPPSLTQLALRRIQPVLYTLSDMAADAAGLVCELGLEPAHIVGASMGGMIAQTLAAEHPTTVRSLVSIMSNTGSWLNGNPSFAIYRFWLNRPPQDRESYIERATQIFGVIGSRGLPQDAEAHREIAARAWERGYDPAASGRQLGAIYASGNRTRRLRMIKAPALVIHGSRDPMVSHSGGVATARAIPGARMVTIKGMGHDLPSAAWPQLLRVIGDHARSADRVPVAAQ